MSLGCGAAAGATDILGTKSRSPGMADSKGTGDCPLGRGSVLGDKGFQFRRSGFPVNKSPTIEEHSPDLHLRLVHRFWRILGGIFAGFIVLKQLVQGFHSGNSVQAELLKIPCKRVHQTALLL
jgi:hypothetical protein